jgi:fumarylacetoacetate (FAA) hydrolase
MKLATLNDGTRDGSLIVVKRDLSRWSHARHIAPTLQAALDDWSRVEAPLRDLAQAVEAGTTATEPWDVTRLRAPLPRAYEWIDGSAFLNHVILVRKARKAELPPTLRTDPLVYQGGSGDFLSPTQDIVIRDESWGCDFESEVCVILGDTPMGTPSASAAPFVRLILLANDVSLRHLIPEELAKGFGFFQSKPATTFSPIACTPDELGSSWKDGRVHLRLKTWLNGKQVGDTEAGPEMHFSFYDLVQHLTRTRRYGAGTILGSGTVSNEDRARGISCLAEQRMIETIEHGSPSTPFLKHGDRVEIEMHHPDGTSLFGRIAQQVRVAPEAR